MKKNRYRLFKCIGTLLFFLLVFISAGKKSVVMAQCCGCHMEMDPLVHYCGYPNYSCSIGCPTPTPTQVAYVTPSPLPTNIVPTGSTPTPPPSGGGGVPPPGEPTPTPIVQCVSCAGEWCGTDSSDHTYCSTPGRPCPDASCPLYCIPDQWGCSNDINTISSPAITFNPNSATDINKYDIRFSNMQYQAASSPGYRCEPYTRVFIGPNTGTLKAAGDCENNNPTGGVVSCTSDQSNTLKGAKWAWESGFDFMGGPICYKAVLQWECPKINAEGQEYWDIVPDKGAESPAVCIPDTFQAPKCQVAAGPDTKAPLIVGNTYGFIAEAKAYDTTRKVERQIINRAVVNNSTPHGWQSPRMADDTSCSGSTCTTTADWEVTTSDIDSGQWCVVCSAYYNDDMSGDKSDKCTGNPWVVPSDYSDCDENDNDQQCYHVVTPTPDVKCPSPALQPSGNAGCYQNHPALSATYSGGADQGQISVYGTCTSDWLSANPFSYTCPYDTEGICSNYYWTARAKSLASPPNCSESEVESGTDYYSIDHVAPTPPPSVASCTKSYSEATKNVTFSWTALNDCGCLSCSGKAAKYWLFGKYSDETSIINNGEWAPASCSSPSYSASCENKWGRSAYLLVNQAKDNYAVVGNLDSDNEGTYITQDWDNFQNNAATCSYQCPLPTLIPTIAITGVLRQNSGSACYSATASKPFTNTNISVSDRSDCVTTACTSYASSQSTYAYGCTVTYNNRDGSCLTSPPDPAQRLTLNSSAENYGSGSWVDDATCNPSGSSTLDVVAGGAGTYVKNIQFNATEDWFKLKHGSFQSSTQISNIIPPVVTSCSADDDASNVLIVGSNEPGVATNVVIGGSAKYSDPHNWGNNSIASDYFLTPNDILSHVKSRKEYSEIVTIDNIQNGISIFTGTLNITDANKAQFDGKKLMLVVVGDVNFNMTGNFAPSGNASVAVIATGKITFPSTMASANGIFMASTVDTGSSTQCFQVNGNLIATTALTQGRQTADTSKPSLFVFFKPNLYVDLLPYLSISKYEWRQLQ